MERETKEKQAEIDKLMTKVAKLEGERDSLQESENLLSEKVRGNMMMKLNTAFETSQ